jgi:hypothetical protein
MYECDSALQFVRQALFLPAFIIVSPHALQNPRHAAEVGADGVLAMPFELTDLLGVSEQFCSAC